MADEIEELVLRVRTDTSALAQDVAAMRASIEGPLVDGAERAGQAIEGALLRAVRTGRLGFDDLRRVALSAMAEIARSALSAGFGGLGGGAGGGGLAGLFGQIALSALGLPGRATGGPVAPGRGYIVGERGPELFVPTASGRIEAGRGGAARDIRIQVQVNGGGAQADSTRMAATGRQIARAVRRAITEER